MDRISTKGVLALCLALALVAGASVAYAATYTATPPTEASAANPYAGCPPDGSGVNFPNSEVEPWVDVNPTDPDNIVGFYQQDRYNNGGAKSNAAAVSTNAGATWTAVSVPQNTRCTDGGPFQRASDPWITFSPNGVLHSMSLVTDPDLPTGEFGANGMVANRSFDGGLNWEASKTLISDPPGRRLNDKNSMTADPNDSRFVYAVWDRLQIAGGDVNNPENRRGLGFKGPIMFTRSTNNGASWEEARKIYESGANKQTIGNQIVVEPSSEGGSLFDLFADITNSSNRRKTFGPVGLSFIRSDDHGMTWTKPFKAADMLPMGLFRPDSVIDPEPVPCPGPQPPGQCPVRAGDLLPEVAVNRSNGNLYAVWMDVRFDGVGHDQIAFTQSTNGGQSWSAPIKVNVTPTSEPNDDQQAFTPSVHVADDGTVAVSYYDFRNNTPDLGTLLTDHWAVHCHSASENCATRASWTDEPETRITPASFDIRQTPFARGYFLGDYVGLASRHDPVSGEDEFVSLFGSPDTPPTASSIFASRLQP